jgi:homoserine dehydrogenase
MANPVTQDVREVRVCLLGFGTVVRRFLTMLKDADERIARQSGVRFLISGTTSRHGGFLDPSGMTAGELLGIVHVGCDELPGPAVPAEELISTCAADVIVEATVLQPGGEPASTHINTAFTQGLDVVTVNKGPVAWQFDRLRRSAERNGCRWRYEGTVADGMPVFDLFESCLRSCEIKGFSGILNATTNSILEALGEGRSFDDAVAAAQEEGVAEADPTHDIDGLDAACKVACLANALMGADITPDDVPAESIRGVTAERVMAARESGRRLCVLCSGERSDEGDVHTSVRLAELPLGHPLAGIHGPALGLILHTDLMGDVLTAELDGRVQQTAYAILADLLTLYSRR